MPLRTSARCALLVTLSVSSPQNPRLFCTNALRSSGFQCSIIWANRECAGFSDQGNERVRTARTFPVLFCLPDRFQIAVRCSAIASSSGGGKALRTKNGSAGLSDFLIRSVIPLFVIGIQPSLILTEAKCTGENRLAS